MRTYWIIGIVAAAVLLAGGGYIYSERPHVPSYASPAAQPPGHGIVGNSKLDTDPYDVLITYTDEGFSPADISIAQGQRVRFLNNSKQTTWPASGLHPTHTLYPEKESSDCLGSSFDSCAELQKGEFFDFTFNYAGVWTFHDHLHPYSTGSITVTASSTQQ
ncbi:cupredoxin domain-containing protein [Candidatus Kaiserbacteria bacterium]|nr:cupredoxin domain-containing protein [Candidatus Kaiserbacteria bacterium]